MEEDKYHIFLKYKEHRLSRIAALKEAFETGNRTSDWGFWPAAEFISLFYKCAERIPGKFTKKLCRDGWTVMQLEKEIDKKNNQHTKKLVKDNAEKSLKLITEMSLDNLLFTKKYVKKVPLWKVIPYYIYSTAMLFNS